VGGVDRLYLGFVCENMQLCVKTRCDGVVELCAEPQQFVWMLKTRLVLLTGIPVAHQQLSFGGQDLSDECSLQKCGLVGRLSARAPGPVLASLLRSNRTLRLHDPRIPITLLGDVQASRLDADSLALLNRCKARGNVVTAPRFVGSSISTSVGSAASSSLRSLASLTASDCEASTVEESLLAVMTRENKARTAWLYARCEMQFQEDLAWFNLFGHGRYSPSFASK